MFSKLKRKDSQTAVRISPPLQTLGQFDSGSQSGHVFPPSPPLGGSQSPESPPHSGHGRTASNVTMSTLQESRNGTTFSSSSITIHRSSRSGLSRSFTCSPSIRLRPRIRTSWSRFDGFGINLTITQSSSKTSPTSPSAYDSLMGSPGTTMDQRTLEVLLNLNFETNNGEYVSTMGGPIYGSNFGVGHVEFSFFA